MGDCPVDRTVARDLVHRKSSRTTATRSPTRTASATGASVSRRRAVVSVEHGGRHLRRLDAPQLLRRRLGLRKGLLRRLLAWRLHRVMNRPATARSAARARYAARPPSTRTWTSGRAGDDLVVRRRAGLKDYHWSFGDDSCQEPVCVDEEGTEADPTCTVCCEGAAPACADVLRGADGLAAAVGVARADEGAVRAAHAGADVDVRAHGPEGRRPRRNRRARPRPGAQVVHRHPRRHHGRPRRARVAVHVRREALPPEAPASEARQTRRPRPAPGAARPPGPPVAAAPELVAPGRRHVREDVLRQPRDGGDELGETRRTGLIATPSNTICRVWSCGSESVLAPGADAIAATPASLKVTQIRNRLGRES